MQTSFCLALVRLSMSQSFLFELGLGVLGILLLLGASLFSIGPLVQSAWCSHGLEE